MQTLFSSRFFVVLLLISVSVFSQKRTRKQLEAERKRLKTEIKQVNRLLINTKKEGESALDDLKDINRKIDIREKLIETISLETNALDSEIASNEKTLKNLGEQLTEMKKDYANMIYKSYKSKSQQSITLFLLSSKSFYQAYKRVKYMKQYSEFRKKQGLDIEIRTQQVAELKDSLVSQKRLKDTLLMNEQSEFEKVTSDKKQQEILLTQIKKKERKYKRELNAKIKTEEQLTSAIDKLIKEAIAKANKKKGVKKSTGFALTPEAKALAVNFEKNKGKLPWPVGSGIITRRFGKQPHPTFKGITIESTGLHITTDKGNDAESVFKGKVLAVQTLAEKRKSVLIQHGNYITAYNNLENVYVYEGQEVDTGQILGKIFTDKVTGKTKLIFVLYKNTVKLNPQSWILKR